MTYTIADVDRVIEGQSEGDDETPDYEDGWMTWKYSHPVYRAEETEIGTIRRIAEHGGEGEGDEYWVVISVTDKAGAVRHFKRCGWYASHVGGELDGPTVEVKPVVREVTFYE